MKAKKSINPIQQALKKETPSDIILSIGKDAETGKVYTLNFAEIPHVFVNGIPGSGKTSFVMTLMAEIMLKYPPEKVRFFVYDGKGLEYPVFNGSPYLLDPVACSYREIESCMKYAEQLAFGRIEKAVDEFGYTGHDIFFIIDDCSDVFMREDSVYRFGSERAWDLRTMISRGSMTRIHYILVSSSPFPKQLLKENTLNNTCRITFRMMDAKYASSFIKEDGAMHLASPGEMICRWINRRYQCQADHLSYEEVEAAVQITQCG